MTILCAPPTTIPARLPPGDQAVALYAHATRTGMGSAGSALEGQCRQAGLDPAPRAWDFLSIALSVLSADAGVARSASADGWTRILRVRVAVLEPNFWNTQAAALAQLLSFLTGDLWELTFIGGADTPAPPKKRAAAPERVVCLLSGGLDSLVGAIDLSTKGQVPVLVSQVASGDKTHQRTFAQHIGGGLRHVQLNHLVRPPEKAERSQRARSAIFLAYGVLAATSLDAYRDGGDVKLVVPENGFISLNVPLTSTRLGSLSTRTTHPQYIQQLQAVLNAAGLRVTIVNPYQLKTKGEMLAGCRDQPLLKKYAAVSTSCGRFARNSFTHCGRCVPCLIRRAAFHYWGVKDATSYVYDNLSIPDARHKDFEDVRATGMAVERVRLDGIEPWIGASLSTSQLGDRKPYVNLVRRGVKELGDYLIAVGAL
jgi:hypothetical protein